MCFWYPSTVSAASPRSYVVIKGIPAGLDLFCFMYDSNKNMVRVSFVFWIVC